MVLLRVINQGPNSLIVGIDMEKNSENTKHKLCAAVYGTTLSERYKIETLELLNIYKNREDVWFFLDDFNNTLDYKLCEILSDPKRCIWVQPKIAGMDNALHDEEEWKKWRQKEFIDVYKTRSVFSKIKEMRLYDKCEYIIKLDSDAYVDMDRFGDWLTHNFNSSDDLYFGETMGCEDWYMVQGIYTVSSGVFSNGEDMEFNETTIKDHIFEDCSFGYLMTEILKLPIIDTEKYLIYSMNETENEIEWNSLSYFERQCRFSCHKCRGKFRELFASETSYMPLHVDHCKFKGYFFSYLNRTLPAEFSGIHNSDPNRTNKARSVYYHVDFEKRHNKL